MNSEETFDGTEELCDLNKNNGAVTSGNNKKRARTIFGTSYKDATKPPEQDSGAKSRVRAKPKFLLGR